MLRIGLKRISNSNGQSRPALFLELIMQAYTFSDLVKIAESIDVNDESAVNQWRGLFQAYNNALNNPPEGVIGVGAITYAQQELAKYQEESNK